MDSITIINKKMIDISEGNIHDIEHFTNVWKYAKVIGEAEGLEERTQTGLEASALTHDIACPLCREKYGNAVWKYQEIEGMPLAKELLRDTGLSEVEIERAVYLVGHHHTPDEIDGMDYQILIEADYIVNAEESGYPEEAAKDFENKYFKTEKGKELLRSLWK